MGRSSKLLEMRTVSVHSVVAFSAICFCAFSSKNELLLMANSCSEVLLAPTTAEAVLLRDMATLPPYVDLVVMQEEGRGKSAFVQACVSV